MRTISSQRYLDDEIVEEKRRHADYDVAVSPVFEFAGEKFRVVLDGHHSLAAAIADGVKPSFGEYNATDCDKIAALDRGDIEGFLELAWIDADWYDINTGKDVW